MNILFILSARRVIFVNGRAERGLFDLLFVELLPDDLELAGCLLAMVVLALQELLKRSFFSSFNESLRLEGALLQLVTL